MKKAVILTGGKQYIVKEGDSIEVERIKDEKDKLTFAPLLIIDGDKTTVGTPEVIGAKVSAKVVEELKADKVTSIRYKAKKRVKKIRGHRQIKTKITIDKISSK
jgi:large subunit ribosomal protein L21